MCDRILLFSTNPGRIISDIPVDLKQPRNRLDPQFHDMVEKIYVAMTARKAAPMQIGTVPAATINTVLPRVSANLMSGLMETLAAAPFNGKADLPVLADELHMDSDELLPVAEVAADVPLGGNRGRRHQAHRHRQAIRRDGDRRSQEALCASAHGSGSACRAYPPRAPGTRQSRGAEEPVPRRTGRSHEHRGRASTRCAPSSPGAASPNSSPMTTIPRRSASKIRPEAWRTASPARRARAARGLFVALATTRSALLPWPR